MTLSPKPFVNLSEPFLGLGGCLTEVNFFLQVSLVVISIKLGVSKVSSSSVFSTIECNSQNIHKEPQSGFGFFSAILHSQLQMSQIFGKYQVKMTLRLPPSKVSLEAFTG